MDTVKNPWTKTDIEKNVPVIEMLTEACLVYTFLNGAIKKNTTFGFLLGETWAKGSFVNEPNHTHSLASFQWSGVSDHQTPIPCQRSGSHSANQGFSTASCNSHHVQSPKGDILSPPPIPPISSTEPIFKTNCIKWSHAFKVGQVHSSSVSKGLT